MADVKAAVRLLSTERPGSLGFSRDILDEAAQQLDRANQIIRRLRSLVGRGKAERRMESIRDIVDEAVSFTLLGADATEEKQIPRCPEEKALEAVGAAVKAGTVWLTSSRAAQSPPF